jgi:putative aminopeptidase FrvX
MDKLLRSLCAIHSPSGEEVAMKEFLMDYIRKNQSTWKRRPLIFEGEELQDCLILVFGEPRVAAFAHMDTTGFMVRYQDQLVTIGGPSAEGDEVIMGRDAFGEIECTLQISASSTLHYRFGRGIVTGTTLVFKSYFKNALGHIVSPYLDNRVGIYNLLRQAETLENGALVFSCGEEAGGGSVPFLVRFIYEKYKIQKMLISDVTWATDGVTTGQGVVISRRDRNIPRKSFFDRIVTLATTECVSFQVEVEEEGSSDGREIHLSPYAIDWCFIGPPVEEVHSKREKVAVVDMAEMIRLYRVLLEKL